MTADSPVPQPEQVAAFFQKHRTGLVTLVFTDLVDSTALLRQLGDQSGATFLRRRRHILREVLHSLPQAEEIETAGDSFLLVFAKPSDAVRFALQSQARLRTFSLESGLKVQERMGVHLGEVVISEHETEVKAKDLYGIQLAACARVMSLAAGGQVLLTRGAFDSARQVLKGEDIPGVGGLRWASHGPYLLKGIEEPVEVCEVAESGETELVAPQTSEKAQRQVRADEEPVLGWRPAVGQEVPNTRWVLEQKLGEGGFGEVWLGRHQTMKERRVFKFCFRADRVRSLKREMTLFRLIKERIGDHPNIVALREVYFEQPPYYLEEDYVAGEDLASWCQSQGGAEKVPLVVKLEIVTQIAEALQAAHEAGVIHRDVKPANILISNQKSEIRNQKFQARLTDFGIGQVVSQEILVGVTRAGFTETLMAKSSSYQTGTLLYLAPELIAGRPASASSDIYSLGVVLYQLMIGDLNRPVTTDWSQQITDPLLREDLARCFAGQPGERFASAGALAGNLRALHERRAVRAKQEAAANTRQKLAQRWRRIRLASVGALILGLGASLVGYFQRSAKARWAREQALPEITRLAKEDNSMAALALARQAARYIPQDPALTNLWPQISVLATLETTPPGADIYFREYRNTNAAWQYVGRSPVRDLRLPTGFYRWRMQKDGYIPLEIAEGTLNGTNTFILDTAATLPPGMVRVSRAEVGILLTGLDHLEPVPLADYFIDKYEVSNRQYQEFVAQGGYHTTNFWKQPFLKQGRSLTWPQAMAEFKDSTGQPGPATWRNGTYPDGQADYPVSGVSWYEAAAYAEFAGKRLPSLYHWNQAAGLHRSALLIPMSNFAGRGLVPVGGYQGMSPAGLLDMAGNVKEWCWNEADDGKRYILGGAWNEPEYMFPDPDARPPFDRKPTFGFRCLKVLAAESWPKQVDARVIPFRRNFAQEKPVNEETFRIYRSLFSYDKTGLDARMESVDDTAPFWRKEKVMVNAAYGNERFGIYLLLPRKSRPPFQAVVYFPGSAVIYLRSSASLSHLWLLESLIESGRAVIYPIYKGTLERGDGLKSDDPAPTSFYRDHVIQWSKDLGRTIDYLETRPDIHQQTLAFCGYSWGAALGALLPALETRLKASVLVCGGFYFQPTLPEVDQINFAPRVTIPTLMLNGRFDFYYPVESSQQPMFRLLGTPPDHKRHVLFDAGHDVPKNELVKEVRDWLDRYLGPVPENPARSFWSRDR